MAKSLIKTVEGIGIWVRETTCDKINLIDMVTLILTVCCIFLCEDLWITSSPIWGIAMFAGICAVIPLIFSAIESLPAYEVYGSDSGIFIFKTNDSKADQIAICKAAKEIEAQCHEIVAKRGELDRIAGNCK
jgi:hypothetical protein